MNTGERQLLVRSFHTMTGEPINDAPEPPSRLQAVLRAKFVIEEALELVEALGVDISLEVPDRIGIRRHPITHDSLHFVPEREPNLVKSVDALRDIEYQIHGVELVLGVHAVSDDTFFEVHSSNMEKKSPGVGEKAVKPRGWKPPAIAEVLRKRFPRKALLFRS